MKLLILGNALEEYIDLKTYLDSSLQSLSKCIDSSAADDNWKSTIGNTLLVFSDPAHVRQLSRLIAAQTGSALETMAEIYLNLLHK